MGSEAAVATRAKDEMAPAVAIEVEDIWLGEDVRVSIGGAQIKHHPLAAENFPATKFNVLSRDSGGALKRAFKPE